MAFWDHLAVNFNNVVDEVEMVGPNQSRVVKSHLVQPALRILRRRTGGIRERRLSGWPKSSCCDI
jgi:hypothetical protein